VAENRGKSLLKTAIKSATFWSVLALLLQFVTGPPTAKLACAWFSGIYLIFGSPEKHNHTTQFSLSFQTSFGLVLSNMNTPIVAVQLG
jgi:hypothetical protein